MSFITSLVILGVEVVIDISTLFCCTVTNSLSLWASSEGNRFICAVYRIREERIRALAFKVEYEKEVSVI
jgi:hypothetical protein